MKQKETGNVLFLILIGIGLFGALSYAVMSDPDGGSSSEREMATLKGVRIAQYGAGLRTAVRRMTMMGMRPDNIILHDTDNWVPCSSGSACVFAPEGGGASLMDLGADPDIDENGNIWNYYQPNDGISIEGIGTASADMVLAREFKYNEAGRMLCLALNKGIGIDGIPGGSGILWVDAAPGEKTACVADDENYYVYYLVFYPL